MKINQQQFNVLKNALDQTLKLNPGVRDLYKNRQIPRAEAVKDINVRFRWDILHASNLHDFVRQLYSTGVNDNHLDTALRNIIPNIE